MRKATAVRARRIIIANVTAGLIALSGALAAQSQAPANANNKDSTAALTDAPALPRNIDLNAATEFGYGFFQQKCLAKITAEDILQFREWRSKSGVGPSSMNMEVGVIRRMLKRAKRWQVTRWSISCENAL